MNLTQRYKTNIKGDIVFTGNTLGLCRDDYLYSVIKDSVGAFTSLDSTLKTGNYPYGTTLDYTQNGSSAVLEIPADSTIEYCELIWSGVYKSYSVDVYDTIDNDVIFVTPDGVEHSISPSLDTKTDNLMFSSLGYYTRSADISQIAKNYSSGTYSIKSVPGALNESDSTQIYIGWTLAVVYTNENSSAKNISLWIGNAGVASNTSRDFDLYDFITPTNTPITGKLMISAGEGDASRDGEQVYFGKDENNLVQLSTDNNGADNFLCSQINDINGQLDTRGTFGDRNQDAINNINYAYARQGYDITTVDVSSYVEPMQTSAHIRISTTLDVCVINAVALELEGTPFSTTLSHELEVDKAISTTGDTLTYTHTITNTGTEPLTNLFFTDTSPQDTEHVEGSVTIDGSSFPSLNPNDGFFIDSLAPGESKQITNQVLIKENNNNMIENTANTSFEYELPDGTTESSNQDSNLVATTNLSTDFTKVKTSSATYLTAGESATQTITLTNNSDIAITGITFTDAITGPATFTAGSVTVNGTSEPTYDITTGFSVDDIAAGDNAIITYEITANDTIDADTITNTATIAYTVDDPTAGSTDYTEDTNTVTLDAISGAITVVKSVNKDYAISSDTLEYTIVITNTGTLTKTDLTFTDTLPTGITFVSGSVTSDGTAESSYDPNTGFALSDLDAGASTTVVFQATVD